MLAQTPQGFRYNVIKKAFDEAAADGFMGTDEASLVERSGHEVAVVMGSPRNIKITTPADMELAEFYLERNAESQIFADLARLLSQRLKTDERTKLETASASATAWTRTNSSRGIPLKIGGDRDCLTIRVWAATPTATCCCTPSPTRCSERSRARTSARCFLRRIPNGRARIRYLPATRP